MAFAMCKIWSCVKIIIYLRVLPGSNSDLKHIGDSCQDLQEGYLGRGCIRHDLRVGEYSADLKLLELNGFNFALLLVLGSLGVFL